MDFNRLLEVASAQQSNLEQKKGKTETKSAQPSRLRKDRQKGVISANVKAFLERREKEEKKKEEGEQRKKEDLLRKREEARHGKAAKAMASRTKDNLQYYTEEKLDRFVAEEKERERKQQEKEERRHQRKLEKQRRNEEGIKRKRRTKHEIAKDKGQNVEFPKSTVGVTIERKLKKRPTPKQSQQPPMDFNALIRMAQKKQNNPGQPGAQNKPGQSGVKVETKRPQPGRPMTQEEKERWERLQSKEYQTFLKKGGKRPEFPGAKRIKENKDERNSRESSLEPKSSNRSITTSKDISRKGEPKSTENKKIEGKKPLLNGSNSKICDKLKHNKREESPSRYAPEPEVNETVVQCGPSKNKAAVKRKIEEVGSNPFDRIIKRYDAHRPPPEKKYRQVIESDSEEEYDSDMDDFIDDGDEENDYSAAIRDIFGYDKKKYRYEDEDLSDMEANYASIMKEEIRSAKIGMMEDLEDMKREGEELKRKAEKKKMREKELKKRRR